jgi:hypothetical protein
VLGALFGLASLARWQNVAFLALPILDGLMSPRRSPREAVWALLGFALAFAPQLAYWNAMAGSPFALSPERHAVEWTQLSVGEVLFSTNRGLFPWSPVIYLGFLGLLIWLRATPRVAALCLLGFLLQVYINSSVAMWYGGWAYGGRRFDNSLVLFVLGFAVLLDFLRRRPFVFPVVLSAVLILWNAGLMLQVKRAEVSPDGNVSFRQVADRTLRRYYDHLGFPSAWPANWLFALRHRVPPEKFDRLYGHRGFGNVRMPMNAEAEGFLGHGWSSAEQDGRGEWFRWSLGSESTILLPLREPHRYVLSAWVRPYEALGRNRVGLRINDQVERSLELEGDATLVWELPPGLFRPGINELRFDFERSRKPSDLTKPIDSRPLAVAFYRLELIARDP